MSVTQRKTREEVVENLHGVAREMYQRMAKGEASREEADMLFDVTKQIEGHTICAFGEGSAWPVQGLLRHFKKEIEKRNNFDPLIRTNKNIPYLVDQHLLDKENA